MVNCSLVEIKHLPRDLLALRITNSYRVNLDISPLRALTSITYLHISYTDIDNIQYIKHLPLKYLSITRSYVEDISIISKLTNLLLLDISDTRVHNLAPLRDLRITDLNICRLKVNSLEPLKNLPLVRLGIAKLKTQEDFPIYELITPRITSLLISYDSEYIPFLPNSHVEYLIISYGFTKTFIDMNNIINMKHLARLTLLSFSINQYSDRPSSEQLRKSEWYQTLIDRGVKVII